MWSLSASAPTAALRLASASVNHDVIVALAGTVGKLILSSESFAWMVVRHSPFLPVMMACA